MKKLLFVTVLVLVLAFNLCFAASKFSDVNGTKYEVAVTKLNNDGVIDGFEDGTFKPQNSVTRAQLCKLLVEALDLKKANNVALTQFGDVSSTQWFYDYVKVAVDNGVIRGYEDATFRPNNDVKYSEMIAMIIRAMGKEKSMTDTTWPTGYIKYASDYGLLSNVTYTDASLPAIRGEVSVALYNMVNRLEAEKAKEPAKEVITTLRGFVESTTTKNKESYAKINGTTYLVAAKSSDFTVDSYAVFEKSSLTDAITLVTSYSVKDLDANANVITYVSGKQGSQEVKYKGSSKYVDLSNSTAYKSYGICYITVEPNSKNVLEVVKHSNKSGLDEFKFAVGDRVIEDSKNKVFLVFHGLTEDDSVSKGKYTAGVEYAEVSYEWDSKSDRVSGVSLPKTTSVEVGSKYTVKVPSKTNLYEFYATNYSGTITVKKDTVIYIASREIQDEYAYITYKWNSIGGAVAGVDLPSDDYVPVGSKYYIDVPEDQYGFTFYCTNFSKSSFTVTGDTVIKIESQEMGGHAGSNMPLIDRLSKEELTEGLQQALTDYFYEADKVVLTAVNFGGNGTDIDSVKFNCRYDVYSDDYDTLMGFTAGDGQEDFDNNRVKNKSGKGVMTEISEGYYSISEIGTGW